MEIFLGELINIFAFEKAFEKGSWKFADTYFVMPDWEVAPPLIFGGSYLLLNFFLNFWLLRKLFYKIDF